MAGRSSAPQSADAPALLPLGHHTGKPAIPLHRPVTVIGSRSNARIHLTSSSVSKAHALVVRDGPITYIRDLASRTRVYINGTEQRDAELQDGDLIKIGSFTFKFVGAPGAADLPPSPPVQLANLDVSGSDLPVPIDGRVMLIGRRTSSDVHLLEDTVSTAHAVIFEMDGQRHVRDLGSRTGTFVNGVKVHQHPLSAEDQIRIGETTLTYTPSSEVSLDAPSEGAMDDVSASAIELELENRHRASESAAPLDLEVDEPPVDEIAPIEEEPVVRRGRPSVAPSAEKAGAGAPLSEAREKLSPPRHASETANESTSPGDTAALPAADGSDDEQSDEADLLPRRGWRPASQQATEQPPAAAEVSQDEPQAAEATTEKTDDVLRFDDQETSDRDTTSDADGGTAVLDVTPPQDEITAGAFTDGAESPSAASNDDSPAATDSEALTLDLEPLSPEKEAEAADFLAELDLSSIGGSDSSDATAGTSTTEQDEASSLNLGGTETPKKPRRSRKKAEPKTPPTERVATSRSRKKPKDTLGETPASTDDAVTPPTIGRKRKSAAAAELSAPIELPIEIPAESSEEVIGETEPTPESALDLTTDDASSVAAPLDLTSETEQVDPLSDTGLDRAVRDLSGETGEIVEEKTEAASEAAEAIAEAPIAEAPARPSAPAWGANQENYLGGVPVSLPPLQPPPSPFGQSQITPAAALAAAEAAAEKPVEDTADDTSDELQIAALDSVVNDEVASGKSADAPADATAEQLDAVNSLIDEMLAPPPPGSDAPAVDEAPSLDLTDVEAEPAAAAAEAEVEAPAPEAKKPTPPPMIPIPPPPAARGGRGRRGRRGAGEQESVPPRVGPGGRPLREDERIPPYNGAMPATRGSITTGFDGLAMPPVREADVFAHMSPPANSDGNGDGNGDGHGTGATANGSGGGAETMRDPFSGLTKPAGAAGGPMTPMDLVEPDSDAPADAGRRGPRRAASPMRGDSFFGSEGATSAPRRRSSVRPVMPGAPMRDSAAADANDPEHLGVDLAASSGEVPLEADEKSRRRPPVVYGPGAPAAGGATAPTVPGAAQADRKRRLRLVRWLFISMFVFAAGAAASAYMLVPVKNSVETSVTYRNFNARKELERKEIQDQQQRLLQAELTRTGAVRWLKQHEPEVAPGFLSDVESYMRVASRKDLWGEGRRGVMQIRYDGSDADADRWRVKAIAASVVEQNGTTLTRQARDAKKSYEELQAAVDGYLQEQLRYTNEAKQLQLQGDSALDAQALAKLKNEVALRDKAWGDAVAAVKAAEAELARLKTVASKDQPAGAAPAAGASDEQIAQMEAQLKDLTTKMTAAQSARAEEAQGARKALDDSMAEFEKQIADARKVMNDSPELAEYVAAAQHLQETTRSLIDDLIRRQEQYFGRLNDYKTKLVEKMEQRRLQSLQQDPKLKELNERRDVATRQYNAAVAAGLAKDADDKKSQVELYDSMIRAQQELLPKDPFYAEAIDQIQQIIDATQKNIEDDRKRTDSMLEKLQKSFVSRASVEKLPEAQKAIAGDLEKRLADINAARSKYNTKMTEAGGQDDEATKALRTQIAALQTSIDSRKKEVADASTKAESELAAKSRAEAISAKERELAELRQAESDARLAYENKEKDFREATATADAARASQDRLLKVQQDKDLVERKLAQAQLELPAKKRTAEEAVYPEPVNDTDVSDVRVINGGDSRTVYAASSAGIVLVGFAAWILMTLHGGPGAEAMDLDSLPRAGAIPPVNPNAHHAPVIEALDTPTHQDDAEIEAAVQDDVTTDGEDAHGTPATL